MPRNGNQESLSTNSDTYHGKPATQHTREANEAIRSSLPFDDTSDFEDAKTGLLDSDDVVTITDKDGKVVWDLEEYKKYISAEKPAPDSVNPSLWRNAQLCMLNGLFEVTDGIYQVRGYDLSNITFVRGTTGWIVIDTLISPECASAALQLINRHFREEGKPDRKVVAIIYSHSHIDHFGGASGVVSEEDTLSGVVQVIASEGFTEHAVSENLIAGNAMGRRSIYMYGSLLPRNQFGGVNSGLGQTVSSGVPGLILPNDIISATGDTRTIDGVKMVFQFTPGSEAPTEMNTYFPEKKALWMSENTTATMHNILTLRGALVRDPLKWAEYLTETIDMWGTSSNVKFQSHHWPIWGRVKVHEYLKKQRDMYKFIHDQSVRLMNQGFVASEISEQLRLPEELYNTWSCRGYYGTLSHNSRAVYQRYMGWYSGNPSDLNDLPPVPAAKKYVEYMNGEEKILAKAREDFEKGEYRWVAMALKHVVFANPESCEGKNLLADSLEQLGYQAESGAWRSVYLQGAFELREGVPTSSDRATAPPDVVKNLTPAMLFDYIGVRIDQKKAAGEKFSIKIIFTDLTEIYTLTMENSVLSYTANPTPNADCNLITTTTAFFAIIAGKLPIERALKLNVVSLSGDKTRFIVLLGMIDEQDFWFNIVTPREPLKNHSG